MALQFACEECNKYFDGNDETYCRGCFQDLEDKIESLEKEIENLKDDIKNLENEAMNSGYDPRS